MLGNSYNFGLYFDLVNGLNSQNIKNDNKRWRPKKEKREIAILLDVQRTLDGMNDETCPLFINQIDYIRRYFKASKARIVLSSYMSSPTPMKPFLKT